MNARLMFVHAHPDDESSKGAATAAHYVDAGVEVVLVTCTGGEAGDVLNPSAEAVAPELMANVRARELEAAVTAIGFTRTYGLGYSDSGYHEDPADVPAGCFSRVPLDGPARDLAALVRHERPHVLVTYQEDGGYPHPDHIMNHLVTMRALELAEEPGAELGDLPGADAPPWRVPKVYAPQIYPPERVAALHRAMLDAGLESPFEKWLERRRRTRELGPDPDARVHCADAFERRDAALLAHVTQIDPNGFWFAVPRELEREHYPYEGYQLLRSDVPVVLPEDDLFAHLDLEAIDAAGGVRPTSGSAAG